MIHHVVFLSDAPLDAILAGRKRWELRLSVQRLAYFSVEIGDRLFLKRSGGEIEALADVGQVDKMPPLEREAFIRKHIRSAEERAYLEQKLALGAKYGAAMRLDNLRRVKIPADMTPRRVRSGWVANFQW